MGGNSPYAKALADYMGVSGLQLLSMLNEAGLAVMEATNYAQTPWVQNSPIRGEIYLNPPAAAVGIPATPPLLKVGRDAPEPPAPSLTAVTTGKSLSFIQRASKQLANK